MLTEKCIAMYIRLSVEDINVDGVSKNESNSVASQRKLIADYISSENDLKELPCVEYADDGYSGMNFERPAFTRMMADAKAGKIHIIVIKDLSRLGREHLEVGNYLERIFPLLGIRVIAVNDHFDSDNFAGTTSGMSVSLKNMLNAMYCRDLSRKVRSAQMTHIEKGEYIASQPRYGYLKDPNDKHHLIVDPVASQVVKLIFAMAAEGKTKTQIVQYLNENHVTPISEYLHSIGVKTHVPLSKEKKLWTMTTVGDLIKNQTYLGKIVWNKRRVTKIGGRQEKRRDPSEWIVVDGTHEPLVSQEIFDKANELAFTHKKIKPRKTSSRKPALLLCHCCKRHMARDRRGSYYRCDNETKSGLEECRNSKTKADIAETAILDAVRKMADFMTSDVKNMKTQADESTAKKEIIAALEGEKKRLTSKKMKLYSDYRTDIISRETYQQEAKQTADRIAEIEQRIPELEKEIEEARMKYETTRNKTAVWNELAALQTFDRESLRKVIDHVLFYGDDKLEIVWKMNDIFHEIAS